MHPRVIMGIPSVLVILLTMAAPYDPLPPYHSRWHHSPVKHYMGTSITFGFYQRQCWDPLLVALPLPLRASTR